MRKSIALWFALSIISVMSVALTPAKYIDINKLRRDYLKSVEDSDLTDDLYDQLENVSKSNTLLYAYKGAVEALVAKHAWNPYNKVRYLNRSQETLGDAIKADPRNAEIRFLRFSIQHYIPSYLGYSGNLDEDRKVIVANIGSSTREVQKVLAAFLVETKRCTATELTIVKRYL